MAQLLLVIALTITAAGFAQSAPVRRPGAQNDARAAERQRDDSFESRSLGRSMRYRVLLPAGYAGSLRRFPVLYLLHGLDGSYSDWTTRTNLADFTRALPFIVVMPDADNSWYTNSASDAAARYEDYVLVDLPADVDAKYRTNRSRNGRAIAGLSMGGYAAIKMALKRPTLFAVAGSFSGAFDVARDVAFAKRFPKETERIGAIFGPEGGETRRENDPFVLARAATPAGAPYLYLDCGTSDSFLASNHELAAVVSQAGLAYEYHEVGGGHTWEYWNARVREFLDVLTRVRLADSAR
jgi:putative tributyrin esterase